MGSKPGSLRWKAGSQRWKTRLNRFTKSCGLCSYRSDGSDPAIDTENCLKMNIHILGLPKRAEWTKPTEFAEQLLITILGLDSVPPTFVVEQAHRVPSKPPKPGVPPGLYYNY